eukprot:1728100-Rhodomonas_salina.4
MLPTSDHDPNGHGAHASDPTSSVYVPAGQMLHGPPSGPAKPRSHLQSLGLPLAGSDTVCSSWHRVHPAGPVTFLKKSGGHGWHGPPSGPE